MIYFTDIKNREYCCSEMSIFTKTCWKILCLESPSKIINFCFLRSRIIKMWVFSKEFRQMDESKQSSVRWKQNEEITVYLIKSLRYKGQTCYVNKTGTKFVTARQLWDHKSPILVSVRLFGLFKEYISKFISENIKNV